MAYTPQTWADLPSETTPLSAARLNYIENGIADLGVMQSWTPTWSNITVGNGSSTGHYAQIGKIVYMTGRITFGTTTSITGEVSISLPVSTPQIFAEISQSVTLRDSNGGTYPGFALVNQASSAVIRPVTASGTYSIANATLNNTTPFAWADTDFINVGITYRVS